MASQETDANGVLFEHDAETEDAALVKKPVQQAGDAKWEAHYEWHIILFVPLIYIGGLYGGYLFLVSAAWQSKIFTIILYLTSLLSLSAGAHRLWSHRAYKAKWPLQLILMFFHTSALQYSVINWVRDHRMHHKYVDTDADPHNATRGFFFSHIGWVMMGKHPEFERKSKELDLSDVETNAILQFQRKYYVILATIICFILPTVIPVYFWNETWTNAIFVPGLLHRFFVYNAIGSVNSVLHKWGYKPYDKNMAATQISTLSYVLVGESAHNYHHAFPWDYRTSELGASTTFSLTTALINLFARIGWAYDLKTISDDVIRKRVIRTGDGSHQIWGWGDKDQSKEEVATAVRIYPKHD
ncbi:acyl-CoA Delta-9 desaturase-like [Cydia amplana]|uniref:acyl-CoA Delta-9 desaturase-like n=1 Tax=Cydia amplana TaxID=1869771 RepID=UPI002FE5E9A6